MSRCEIAIVSRDPKIRMAAARAFDAAPAGWDIRLYDEAPERADVVVVGPDVDLPGIRFDPERPGAVIEEIAHGRRTGTGVVVASARPGSGCTTVALHLARSMARRAAVAVCETTPGIARRLDMGEARTWTEPNPDPMASMLPVAGGFRVLLSPPPGCVTSMPKIMDSCSQSFDRVVIDAGTSVTKEVLESVGAGVLVCPPSRVGASLVLDLLGRFSGTRWAVVTNRTAPGGTFTRSQFQNVVARRVVLELPYCGALRDVEDAGSLLKGPWWTWSRRIDALARALERG